MQLREEEKILLTASRRNSDSPRQSAREGARPNQNRAVSAPSCVTCGWVVSGRSGWAQGTAGESAVGGVTGGFHHATATGLLYSPFVARTHAPGSLRIRMSRRCTDPRRRRSGTCAERRRVRSSRACAADRMPTCGSRVAVDGGSGVGKAQNSGPVTGHFNLRLNLSLLR